MSYFIIVNKNTTTIGYVGLTQCRCIVVCPVMVMTKYVLVFVKTTHISVGFYVKI